MDCMRRSLEYYALLCSCCLLLIVSTGTSDLFTPESNSTLTSDGQAALNGTFMANSTDPSLSASMNSTESDDAFLLNDNADYLKETTKIVTIKIYPPPAKGKNGTKGDSGLGKVKIPLPFDLGGGGGGIQITTPPAVIEETKPQNQSEAVPAAFSGEVLPSAKELTVDFNSLCRDGAPFVVDGSPLYCTLNSGCPTGYWCHTGSSKAYTFCCPNAQVDNGCNLAMSAGNGDGRMERWYFDAVDSTCKLFIYTGYGGNQNNFLTHQDCVDICGLRLTRGTVTPMARVASAGQNIPEERPEPLVDPRPAILAPLPSGLQGPSVETEQTSKPLQTAPPRHSSPFGKIYTPLVSAMATAVSSVPLFPRGLPPGPPGPPASAVFSPGGSPKAIADTNLMARCRDVVNVPRLDGKDDQKLETRWYYDYVVDTCKSFSYAGHDSTSNNFGSEYECNYHCKGRFLLEPPSQPSPTPPPPSPPGPAPTSPQPPIEVDIDHDRRANPCDMPPNAGHGYLRVSRWFFDSEDRYCREFFFSGQGGNANNFDNEEQCLFACVLLMPKHQRGDPCGQPRLNGNGTAALTRFFFDQWSGMCEEFLYTGDGGNRNNFFTLQECRLMCPDRVTTASTGRPRHSTPGPYPASRQATTDTTPYPSSTRTMPPARAETLSTISPWEITGWPEIFNPFSSTSPPAHTTTEVSTTPAISDDGRVHPCKGVALPEYTFCGPYNNYKCPSSMYCHVGSTAAESVCCPTRGGKSQTINVCTLPVDPGLGTAQLTRWYFNGQTNQCDMFLYRGMKGNQNNFLTFDMCKENCATNVCGVGSPYQVNGQNVQCSTLEQSVCPETHYCHVGADMATSLCCPRHGNPCTMPIAIGTGKSQLQRWAYSSSAKSCQTFIYTGLGGNENNFITEADCIGTCQAHLAPSMNPCSSGQPAIASNGVEFIYCSTSNLNSCPANHYCHVGGTPESTLCCPLSSGKACGMAALTNGHAHDHARFAGYPTPCQLPLNTGTGTTALSRWYFESASSACKPFVYTGMGGNENNFLSVADCRQACPEFDNPCPGGTPPFNTATGQVQFCSALNPNCPSRYWCHYGADRQTSVCCPFAANPCSMPRVEGVGRHQLQRFYFDQQLKQCRTFIYSGASGNQNNFVSLAECEATCPTLDNPCTLGMPASGKDGNPIYCSTANQDICPSTYWCHIGSSASTTLCCPGTGDPCQMPPAKGAGTSVFNRWYYNNNTKTCVSFTYSGRGGNQNNFLSLSECRNACPEYKNPCSTGQPHIGLKGKITKCSPISNGRNGRNNCPITYWCHSGVNAETSVCCPGAGDPCELSMSVGNGQTKTRRFYYNRDSQTCQEFTYSGSGGNENNFPNREDCERRCPVFHNPCSTGEPLRNMHGQTMTCSVSSTCPHDYYCHVGTDEQATVCCPQTGDPCKQEMKLGNGTAAVPRFYFNGLAEQCLQFTYTGLGGNENNFLSRVDCERACPVFESPCAQGDPATTRDGHRIYCTASNPHVCPAKHWCHVGDSKATSVCCPGENLACQIPAVMGDGEAAMSRWHFDIVSRTCARFVYSGKGGNANNFLTMQDCIAKCLSVPDVCPSTPAPTMYSSNASARPAIYCDPQNPASCPSGFWCHVGGSAETTVCCPGATNPCTMPMSGGRAVQPGQTPILRWYFDSNSQTCKQFQYGGASGNQNNFLSFSECHGRCSAQPSSSCPRGSPYRNPLTGQSMRCNAEMPVDLCPPQYSCDSASSLCCPRVHVSRSALQQSEPFFNLHQHYLDHRDASEISSLCQLPVDVGEGLLVLPRWYFEASRGECRQFSFAGTAGNENNFLTQDECRKSCSEFIHTNPCEDQKQALRTTSGQLVYCSAGNPEICPNGYYCHVGLGRDTTVCCPSDAEDSCSLPMHSGMGQATVQRWYFDAAKQRCRSFTYTGIGGNSNNFVSLDTCKAKCSGSSNTAAVEFINPCLGEPFRIPSGQALYCDAGTACPRGYFCQIGGDTLTSMCCPSDEDPCTQPLIIGSGTASLTRWHFDSSSGACMSFEYSGMSGNENNFLTLDECQSKCGAQTMSPCANGVSPYLDNNGVPMRCLSDDGRIPLQCPQSHFCHFGHDMGSTVCCPMQEGNLCQFSKAEGHGKKSAQRWFFDQSQGYCSPFVYKGLGGNANNFRTEAECSMACGAADFPSTLTAPFSIKQRSSSLSSFGKCPHGEPLIKSDGNPQECSKDPSSPDATFCPQTFACFLPLEAENAVCCPDPKFYCAQEISVGTSLCQSPVLIGAGERFGFDATSGTCIPFHFEGCGGNLNNFPTYEHCVRICIIDLNQHSSPIMPEIMDEETAVELTEGISSEEQQQQQPPEEVLTEDENFQGHKDHPMATEDHPALDHTTTGPYEVTETATTNVTDIELKAMDRPNFFSIFFSWLRRRQHSP